MAKRILIGTIILLGTVTVLLLYLPSTQPAPRSTTVPISGEVDIGGPFILVDTRGEPVNENVLIGRYTLIYFGFTYCPDICPLTLQALTEALDILGPAGDNILPIFISLDPERDTPDVMADYVANFHPRFMGLTGTVEQTEEAARQYRVFAAKSFIKDADGNDTEEYLVDHTGFTYLMTPAGRYADHFSKDTTAQQMAERLKQIMTMS
jgi:cytochrome oxidase Cu insertion factor (SCO1/SenC/PrrC family)